MGGIIERSSGRIAARLRGLAAALLRLQRLAFYGLYLVLWSKLFPGRRSLAPLESALLSLKSVEHLPPDLLVGGRQETARFWTEGFAAVHAALFMNLKLPGRASRSRHAHPAPAFRAIYLWDSAFIAQIWKWWDEDVAWDVLRAVIDAREGGRLQHFAADFARSPLTQPPLIAWSLAALAPAADPQKFRSWARHAYAPLRDYSAWLEENRRLPGGLFAWAHAYESGVENAPRFSSADERRLDETGNLAAPDFCSYMVLHYEALAELARQLGEEADAGRFAGEAAALRDAVNAGLWDDEEGLYFDRDVTTGAFIRSRTIASLLPLWAGIPDPGRAARLRAHILDPTAFNTTIPLPSVSLADPGFEKDMWRGPVWLNLAFAVVSGLQRYGFREAAADLAYRLCDGVYRTFERTGHFHEFYDPERHDTEQLHRKRGNRWKRLTLGTKPVIEFVGWSGLVNVLVTDVLFGLERDEGRLAIRPQFPPRAEGLRFTLTLPRDEAAIEIEVGSAGAVSGRWRLGGRSRDFSAGFGERMRLDRMLVD